MALVPVILSGGAGSRLWPLSRKAFPKPFVALPDGESPIQKTLRRVIDIKEDAPLLTVTNRDYYFLTRDTFAEAVYKAQQLAEQGYLVTLAPN
ncbi:sugar phosphate nucleotidyltransferase [Acidithiobacillus sulfurivorans]|uniref:sugar phosphate nucleotidyltransferase n=1 Tax=Acidithiobacillus sulfurivorans TaxID=1958756 RepID=UPI003F6112DF